MVLCLIIVLVVILLEWYKSKFSNYFFLSETEIAHVLSIQHRLDSLLEIDRKHHTKNRRRAFRNTEKSPISISFTTFDPNKIDAAQWVNLGFSKRQAKVILNYKARIGGFKSLDQLQKCYVISESKFEQLKPYIKIVIQPKSYQKQKLGVDSNRLQNRRKPKKGSGYNLAQKKDINIADLDQLKKVYGIGDKLAARLLKYRAALGGFATTDQIFEVYGLSDTLLCARIWQRFYIEEKPILKKINLHNTSFDTLVSHPYITRRMAQSLLDFQKMFGEIKRIDRLQQLEYWDEKSIKRLQPYIKFGR